MTRHFQRLREWSPILPLLLLLGATYWLDQQVQPMITKSDASKRHDPDVIISNMTGTTMDTQGAPHFILSAQKLVHYPDDDSTHLDEPHLTTLYPDRPPIYASARRGEISREGTDVFLHDDVKIVRAANATQSEISFSASYLHAAPDQDLMDTDRPVIMTDAHNVIHATGMIFDNKARTIKLLAQVKGQHEVSKR